MNRTILFFFLFIIVKAYGQDSELIKINEASNLFIKNYTLIRSDIKEGHITHESLLFQLAFDSNMQIKTEFKFWNKRNHNIKLAFAVYKYKDDNTVNRKLYQIKKQRSESEFLRPLEKDFKYLFFIKNYIVIVNAGCNVNRSEWRDLGIKLKNYYKNYYKNVKTISNFCGGGYQFN